MLALAALVLRGVGWFHLLRRKDAEGAVTTFRCAGVCILADVISIFGITSCWRTLGRHSTTGAGRGLLSGTRFARRVRVRVAAWRAHGAAPALRCASQACTCAV